MERDGWFDGDNEVHRCVIKILRMWIQQCGSLKYMYEQTQSFLQEMHGSCVLASHTTRSWQICVILEFPSYSAHPNSIMPLRSTRWHVWHAYSLRYVFLSCDHNRWILCSNTQEFFCFLLSSMCIGAQNCLQPLNQRLYNHARMQATAPPPHFDNQFFDTCNELTTHVYGIDLFRDITPSNCIQVYKYLVNNIRL